MGILLGQFSAVGVGHFSSVVDSTKLIVKDDRLVGRYSKRDIEQFLTGHGRLDKDEVVEMIKVLKRQLSTEER